MPEHGSGETIKHLALTHLIVCIFTAGSFFNFMQYANGVHIDTCKYKCKCSTEYRFVNCTDRAFRDIPNDIPQYTINLNFDWNFVDTLSPLSFENIRSLESFSIANNRLQSIENGTFNGLDNLTNLILYGNKLSEVPSAILALTNLTVLDLSRNRISEIDGSSFSQSLRELYLCENSISIIDRRSFMGLKNIEVINLSNNHVHIVTSNSLLCNPHLKGFNIDHNAIKTLPKGWLGNATNLLELYLTGNRITWTTDVREWFVSKSPLDLRNLFLNKNHISNLPASAFRGIPRMETLHLSNNQIQYLSRSSFDELLNLEYLIISNNRLKSLPPELVANNKRLKGFVLRGNRLTRLPVNFLANNLDLERLDLAGNRLTSLPKGLLGSEMNPLPNLTELDLRNNIFKRVPNLHYLPELTFLQLSNNKISKLSYTVFSGNRNLVQIILDGNMLESVDRKTFSMLSMLEVLSLRDNVFMCDCKMLWLFKKNTNWALETLKTVSCKYPYDTGARSLNDINDYSYQIDGQFSTYNMQELCRGPKEKGKYLMIACIWILIVVFILVVYWSRKVLKAQKRLNAGKPKIRRRYSLIPNKMTKLEKPPWSSFRRHSRKKNGNYTNLSKSSSPPRITVSCLPHSGMVYKQRETTV